MLRVGFVLFCSPSLFLTASLSPVSPSCIMAIDIYSLEATLLSPVIEAAGGKPPESESESESDGCSYQSDSEWETDSRPAPWDLKHVDDVEESDMCMYDDDPMPILFVNRRFRYMNKAAIKQEEAAAEHSERVSKLPNWVRIFNWIQFS